MLDKEHSTKEYRFYSNKCKDGRIRCVLVYSNGEKRNISYPKLIMEQFLGRKLLPHEQVHHIDENPLNNEINNLKVVILGEHQSFHSKKQESHPVSEERRKQMSEMAKKLWKNGVYDNRKNEHLPKSEEHKRKISESIKKYYKLKRAPNQG